MNQNACSISILTFINLPFQALGILDEVGDLLKLKYSRLKKQPAISENDSKDLRNGTSTSRYDQFHLSHCKRKILHANHIFYWV